MHPSELFALDPSVTFLNHGSFGATPQPVLAAQSALRARMEAQPVAFLGRELEELLDEVCAVLGDYLRCDAADLALLPNATHAVNAVLRSIDLRPGDEIVVTDHGYAACTNAARHAAERAGASVVTAHIPFPVASSDEALAAVLAAFTPRTRLALVDHVTSPTALVLPVEALAAECARRGVDLLVDGAHAPGMLPLDLDALGAAFYTGNLHKWVCAPKGAAFLHVRRDRQAMVRPLAISHGASTTRTDRSRFRVEFAWQGTDDPTALLAVPAAIGVLGALAPGGWDGLRARNHAVALRARDMLCEALDVAPPAPDAMLGSMATVILPPSLAPSAPSTPFFEDALQEQLWNVHRIEVPVMRRGDALLLRVSAQIYNSSPQYHALARVLADHAGR